MRATPIMYEIREDTGEWVALVDRVGTFTKPQWRVLGLNLDERRFGNRLAAMAYIHIHTGKAVAS